MKIKNLEFPRTAALAPMAGFTDTAFRILCREFGSAYTVGEMTSAKGILYENEKSLELLRSGPAERPFAVQLFGSDPKDLARAAERALDFGPDMIDINMGCPAPKIVGGGAGSALMKTPELAEQIAHAVVKAAGDIPVTVKFRKGWDAAGANAPEFAKRMENAGVSAVAVHGRTRADMYSGFADTEIIRAVKQSVSVPVIANGDVCDAASALNLYEKTGADLVMIGRGALGAPWVFAQIKSFFETGITPPPPSTSEKMNVLARHTRLVLEHKPEYVAMREMRSHAAFYMRGLVGAPKLRALTSKLEKPEDIERLIELVLAENPL